MTSGLARLDLDAIEGRFADVVATDEWRLVEQDFARSDTLFLVGNGGNLAVAQHAAADITRLTDKRALAPGGAVTVTSLINEAGYQSWLSDWLEWELRGATDEQRWQSMLLGLSCSGVSPPVMAALASARARGLRTALLSAAPAASVADVTVTLGTGYYHSSETLMLLLTYQLTISVGGRCPAIPGASDSTSALTG